VSDGGTRQRGLARTGRTGEANGVGRSPEWVRQSPYLAARLPTAFDERQQACQCGTVTVSCGVEEFVG